ncbi:MAG: transporter, family, tetracycline resistance protein [Blastocatellia bacterium]|jgi:DHA1 family tetracycline resistance protein-like MFS transporter|nr:transporter, family, tetracycline resistance protein [Blastocatellia bacterium]
MKRSPLLVIFITVFIDLIGFGIVIPVLPFYVEGTKFNASPRAVGLLFASYSIMQLIFTPILGRLSDKHGRRPILFFSLLGTSLGFLILGLATTVWMLFLGRIIDGITGGNISTAQAYIADITTPENRAKGMGMIGAAFGMGFIFGPAIGGVLSKWGISVPFFFAAGLALANAVLLYFVLPETVTPGHPARTSAATGRWSQLAQALKQSRLAFVLAIYFLAIVAFSIMTTSFALFTMFRFGYDAHDTGWLFVFVGVIGALIQGGLIGRLVKRFGEVSLIVTGALLFAASLFTIPFTGPHTGLLPLLLVGGTFAVGNSLSTPALTGLASKSVGRGEQGGVLGITQSVASLARVVGPLIASALIYSALPNYGEDKQLHNLSDHSLRVTFWTAAAIMFAAFLLAVYFARNQSTNRTEGGAMTGDNMATQAE